MVQKERRQSVKPLEQWPIVLAVAITLANGAFSLYNLQSRSVENSVPVSPKQAPAIVAVTGLGRLEPEGEVIRLSAPTSVEGARVTQLLVKETGYKRDKW